MLKPTSLLPLLLLGARLALAQPAAATDYCVDVAMTCDAANNLGSFEDALNKADDAPNATIKFSGRIGRKGAQPRSLPRRDHCDRRGRQPLGGQKCELPGGLAARERERGTPELALTPGEPGPRFGPSARWTIGRRSAV
jgi:hypothetical protein